MSRAKQPRITAVEKDPPAPPEETPGACLTVKICTVCNGYAFSVFRVSSIETVCPCGKNQKTIEKQLPLTHANMQEIKSAFEKLVK
mgnify:CR=1 FL=1